MPGIREATAALEYFLWVRSALPRSKQSLNRCADLATSAQPGDEGLIVSLVLVWGKRCRAVAGRCPQNASLDMAGTVLLLRLSGLRLWSSV